MSPVPVTEELPLMPYETYRLYQAERAKSPAEVERDDERAGRLTAAVSSLFRAARAVTNMRRGDAIA